MANQPHGHKQPRKNDDGRFAKKAAADKAPKKYSVEVVPNRGYGDTGRYPKKKSGR